MLMLYNIVMKKKLLYIAFVFSLVFTVSPAALAVTEGRSGWVSASRASNETATEDSAGRSSRVETYKKELKETLSNAAKLRIAERCVASQGLVKVKSTNNTAITKERNEAYEKIIANLKAVAAAAQKKNVNVNTLNANVQVLETKVLAFQTANTTYQQALGDLTAVDCKTDPTAFKAALETVRKDQLAVFNAAKDIRTYLKDTVKPTLQAIKAQLKTQDN